LFSLQDKYLNSPSTFSNNSNFYVYNSKKWIFI
jgi:hypothetical protein